MQNFDEYISDNKEALIKLIDDICRIPAPSHHEEERAEFCRRWLEGIGCSGVYIDNALNVIYRIPAESEDAVLFIAHTDTVFPDTTPFDVKYDGDRMFCPGIGDDTANLAVLMFALKYIMENKITPSKTLIFCANSCEEGLGNLKGSRALMEAFGNEVSEFVSFDGYLDAVATKTVGSERFSVTVETEGGHSYALFGNKNAIYYMSRIISDIYDLKVPEKENTKTTYNVGIINGGTSVNTIAQNAGILCEYRSDDYECLCIMREAFKDIFERYEGIEGVSVTVKTVGERPCAQGVDKEAMNALVEKCSDALHECGITHQYVSSSTDCNIPMAMGIPAVCPGVVMGGGAHTRGEWISKSSLEQGLKFALTLLKKYF